MILLVLLWLAAAGVLVAAVAWALCDQAGYDDDLHDRSDEPLPPLGSVW